LSLLVLDPGLFTTVQDLGRSARRAFGVPQGGAMDRAAFQLANRLAGNSQNEATLEMTLRGVTIEAQIPVLLGLAGGQFRGQVVNGQTGSSTPPGACRLFLPRGARLELGPMPEGCRGYLAIHGGIQTPPILGSRSDERPLSAGAVLPVIEGPDLPTLFLADVWQAPSQPGAVPVRYLPGPDSSPAAVDLFESSDWTVEARSDRAGVRLSGPVLPTAGQTQRLSSPVLPGCIQVAGGQPIVLGPDSGTMGGYEILGCVIASDLDRMAQWRPGDQVRFQAVDLDEARRTWHQRQSQLRLRDLALSGCLG
jgi:biotin-dependent carboxylase-like uncharacterized protein